MTDEVRNKIEALEVLKLERLHPVTKEPQFANVVYKNQVISLVEELTKWNNVDDCLPEMNQVVLVKRNSGRLGICEFKSKIFIDTLIGLSVNVTEWKPIN